MTSLYVHLADAGDAVQGAVDGVAAWYGSPTPVGMHAGRGALAAIDQALRYLALARGELLDQVATATGTTPSEYDRLIRERYPLDDYALAGVYDRDELGEAPVPGVPLPANVEGYQIIRAAIEGRL